ncbi:phenylacetate--CoA ligase family protein [Aggregatilinea lenta]|uniref:phenylacetate--CoA ligase family protein n=1 Tax=Aggregatilinea lenta TaxID=913108 RepID=UPI0013C2A3D7|nr:phenylacetate--CoA ligase family protein [Aggregatilinea lenta]
MNEVKSVSRGASWFWVTFKGITRYKHLEVLLKNEKLSQDQLQILQWQKLTALLTHAYQNVPYYQRVFEQLGATPRDIRTKEDFAQLPILTRQDVRDNLELLYARNVPESKLVIKSTSGSSGNPLDFYYSHADRERAEAGGLRNFTWAGLSPSDKKALIWIGPIRSPIKKFFTHTILLDCFDLTESRMEEWLEELKRFKPRFVYGYTSAVAHFAQFVEGKHERLDSISAVFVSAEKLYREQRILIEKVFDCKVYDHYGSVEVPTIASECEKGSMHILNDLVYVEFLPWAPSDKLFGLEQDRIIVTSLDSYAMPFIRYANGDLGMPSTAACSCGRPFPTMSMGVSRTFHSFLMPDGQLVNGIYFQKLFLGLPGVTDFRVHQKSPEMITVYVVPETGVLLDTEQFLKGVINTIKQQWPSVSVDIEFLSELPPIKSGKRDFVISDVVRSMN